MATTKRRAKPPPGDEATPDVPTNGDAHELNGDGENGSADSAEEPRRPAHVVSYLVARDAFVQASIWARTVQLHDGTKFTAHDVNLRKRYKDANGEWQSRYSFRGSELYAVAHAVSQANAWILETRASHDVPF